MTQSSVRGYMSLLLLAMGVGLSIPGAREQRKTQGDGSFIANWTGELEVSGLGVVVASQFTGRFAIRDQESLTGTGYRFVACQEDWDIFEATNASFTVRNETLPGEVTFAGRGSATGTGIGWVSLTGEGSVVKGKDGSGEDVALKDVSRSLGLGQDYARD